MLIFALRLLLLRALVTVSWTVLMCSIYFTIGVSAHCFCIVFSMATAFPLRAIRGWRARASSRRLSVKENDILAPRDLGGVWRRPFGVGSGGRDRDGRGVHWDFLRIHQGPGPEG